MSKGGLVISALNQLVDLVEEHLGGEIDINGWAGTLATTEYHLRRMFSSLAGMPLSEYVRRRRMTVAAAATEAPYVHNHSSGFA
jgi:AraC family transcriptional regulator